MPPSPTHPKLDLHGEKLTYYLLPTTYDLLPTTYYLLSCYLLILTLTTSNKASINRRSRLRAVLTFAANCAPVRSFCEFKRSAVARWSPPFRRRGCYPRPAGPLFCFK